jgi:hypothetical protein
MATSIDNYRIDGLRITVFDVFHYLDAGRSVDEILEVLPLSRDQVQAAIDYIASHGEEVRVVNRHIEERNRRGNPPAIQALSAASRAKMLGWLKQRETITA